MLGTDGSSLRHPAPRGPWANAAAASRLLLGTQPVQRQSPPVRALYDIDI